ncbi:MAG: 2-phosphoglycerate kinase [Candidatus Altiarchaeales archaeon HGW-Altiarchaeales-3]|nr:MAG: 2-phosphoglycerate kinase [Candidatus Altiarchaeales archaeon HGW-Altiarchaeales-3]
MKITPSVFIKEGKSAVPFSRGILTRSIVRSGIDELKAYELAMDIKSELVENKKNSIEAEDLFNKVCEKLRKIKPKFEKRYKLWRDVRNREEPILILLGGVSGTGTTTVGADLGHSLSIRRVIGTDTIREIMRKIITPDLLPSIHASSYEAWKSLKIPVAPEYDKTILGFRSQVESISVGVEALIDRSLYESISGIIEGTHLVPGFIDEKYMNMPNIFFFVLNIEDEKEHQARFHARAYETRRASTKYLRNFNNIRKIQEDVINKANLYRVKVIENSDLERTTKMITEIVLDKMAGMVKKK